MVRHGGTVLTMMHRALFIALLMALSPLSQAQEALDPILARGYIAHWLVCGPFESDLPDGIIDAISRGQAPLGDKDFMEPIGGIAKLRPKHKQLVPQEGQDALWQRAGTQDASLNLSPFFPKAKAGIAYAGFYVKVNQPRYCYIDLQSPLGVRGWMNGFPLQDIKAAPLRKLGVDRFVVPFKKGTNLLIFEVPGASYDAMADAIGVTRRELAVRTFANRPLLKGKSGFEIALKIAAAMPLKDLFVVPQLEQANRFSGIVGDVQQHTLLTLFNPIARSTDQVDILVRSARFPAFVDQVLSIDGETAVEKTVEIPISNASPGETLPVDVSVTYEDETISFSASVLVLPKGPGGDAYVVTGLRHTPDAPETQGEKTVRQNTSAYQQVLLSESESDYGFDLGMVCDWYPFWLEYPEARDRLDKSIGFGKSASQPAYANPDQRIVGGEVVLRNLLYGHLAGNSVLRDGLQGYQGWNCGALTPQLPQLLEAVRSNGYVSNLKMTGLAPLSLHLGLDGTSRYMRRKQVGVGPASIQELRHSVALQRRELVANGFESDVLINNSLVSPPEPFYTGATEDLRKAFPSIRVTGAGVTKFFQDVDSASPDALDTVPLLTKGLTAWQPGTVLAQPELKAAYAELENRLSQAEQWATFAALMGATYPDAALTASWRQLIWAGAPDRLGIAQHETAYLNTLAECRDALWRVNHIQEKAARYIANMADTLQASPNQVEGARVLAVFNPSTRSRSGLCERVLEFPPVRGLQLLDDTGQPVPFMADQLKQNDQGLYTGARIRFVAADTPAVGYKMLYLIPAEGIPVPLNTQDRQIENEYYLVQVDRKTGDIVHLIDKNNAVEYAGEGLNRINLLKEKGDRLNGGRELWTSGEPTDIAGEPPSIECAVSPWMQMLTIRNAVGDGAITRTITVYKGISQVFCETVLENISIQNTLVAAGFHPDAHGMNLRVGERYGVLTARQGKETQVYQTRDAETVSGTTLQPAHQWAALTPDDHILVGGERVIPLMPAVIIHNGAPVFEAAAQQLQAALIKRGIPAVARTPDRVKQDFLWSDGTRLPALEDEHQRGRAMQFVLGTPSQNQFYGKLLDKVPDAVSEAFVTRMNQGTVFVVADHLDGDTTIIPTVLMAGQTPELAARQVRKFTETLSQLGYVSLPQSADPMGVAVAVEHRGLGILFEGTRLAAFEADGSLTLGLAHGSETDTMTWVKESNRYAFAYAIQPFMDDWRQAHLPALAREYQQPFLTVETDVHPGKQPVTQSLLAVDDPDFVVTAVTPARSAAAEMVSSEVYPRDGFLVRGYEANGAPWKGRISAFTEVRQAANGTWLGYAGNRLDVDGRSFTGEADAFEIKHFWLLPSIRFTIGKSAQLAPDEPPVGYVRYWQHHAGAGNETDLPVGVLLKGELAGKEARVEAYVANNLTDKTIEGVVTLSASEDWSFGPPKFYYKLAPGEYQRETIELARVMEEAKGSGLVATVQHSGMTVRDVLVDDGAPTMVVLRNEAQVKATIRSNCGVPVEGIIELIQAPSHWSEIKTGLKPEKMVESRIRITIPPFGKQDVFFAVPDYEQVNWSVVKLATNGHVLYEGVE